MDHLAIGLEVEREKLGVWVGVEGLLDGARLVVELKVHGIALVGLLLQFESAAAPTAVEQVFVYPSLQDEELSRLNKDGFNNFIIRNLTSSLFEFSAHNMFLNALFYVFF